MYLYVEGSNFHDGRGQANISADGREIEIGPYSRNGIRVHRRIRVYSDRPLARWIEIVSNPTAGNKTVKLRLQTYIRTPLSGQKFSSGASSWSPRDRGMMVTPRHGNYPRILHMLAGVETVTRPADVQISGNVIRWNYKLTLEAGQTVVICHFIAQHNSAADLEEMMKGFRPQTLVRDLSPALRDRIVNWRLESSPALRLLRDDKHDTVIRAAGGRRVFGKIIVDDFRLTTLHGELSIPAKDVLGMIRPDEEFDRVRLVLTDGQAAAGTLSTPEVTLEPVTGGRQTYPLARVAQWSFAISPDKPESPEFAGPYVTLDSGDRLRVDPESLSLTLRTPHGAVPLEADAMHLLELDGQEARPHQAIFANGSTLSGLLVEQRLRARLLLGPELDVPMARVVKIEYTRDTRSDELLSRVKLAGGDELFVRMDDEPIVLVTPYGDASIRPGNIQACQSLAQQSWAARIWNGSILRGTLENDRLSMRIVPGPRLRINPERIASISRTFALPPTDIVNRVKTLVRQLGDGSYERRREATEQLKQLGEGIVPLLRRHAREAADLEIRNRLREILETHSASAQPAAHSTGYPRLQQRIQFLAQ
jgi:hypothetical protein